MNLVNWDKILDKNRLLNINVRDIFNTKLNEKLQINFFSLGEEMQYRYINNLLNNSLIQAREKNLNQAKSYYSEATALIHKCNFLINSENNRYIINSKTKPIESYIKYKEGEYKVAIIIMEEAIQNIINLISIGAPSNLMLLHKIQLEMNKARIIKNFNPEVSKKYLLELLNQLTDLLNSGNNDENAILIEHLGLEINYYINRDYSN